MKQDKVRKLLPPQKGSHGLYALSDSYKYESRKCVSRWMEHKVPADRSRRQLYAHHQTSRGGGAGSHSLAWWPKTDRQDGISGMFNQSLGKLEGCWNYTPPLTGCARLRAVTHSSKECNLCVCLLTQALCSKPQEGHAPPQSQFQFPIKVNTVWKCSHTLAQYDWSWFEFSRLIKDRVWECSLFCSYTQMIRGASRFMARHMLTSEELETHGAVGTHKNNTGITSTERADIHSEAHMSTWL